MLISIAIILLSGFLFSALAKKIKLPGLFGMILAGILIGPSVLNLLSGKILDISAEIRKIALIIILIRAGLKLSVSDLKKVGRPAILMCFIPATLEIIGTAILAPVFLKISLKEALVLGAVIGAVSPAVIVPRMIKLIDEGYGKDKSIPQMILAGASVDDVYVIVLFTTFTSLLQGKGIEIRNFINIPISIVTGVLVGLLFGFLVVLFFKFVKVRTTIKVVLILAVCFFLTFLEDQFGTIVPFASLLSVMSLGLMIKMKNDHLAVELSKKYDKMWVVAEVFLFVLVGASVQIESALLEGPLAILLVLLVLLFRMLGVFLCLLGTQLTIREKLFSMLSYTPKATVQAAIGGIPLAMGLSCGNTVLTVSVISILLTAPLGAFAIDLTYKKWLKKE